MPPVSGPGIEHFLLRPHTVAAAAELSDLVDVESLEVLLEVPVAADFVIDQAVCSGSLAEQPT